MSLIINEKKLLGINGLGRIGKLTLWYHLIQRKFDGIVVNIGREVGKSLDDLVQIILNDSTYGRLDHFLYGHSGKKCQVEIPDYESQIVFIDGFPIKILNKERSPQNINWRNEKVRIVVDCTGKFLDPTISPAEGKDALCGHLTAGAQKVISSAPFKIKNASTHDLDSFPTLIYGINHTSYDPLRHHIISAASCTTTGLAHMIKPLLENKETSNVLTASMSTVHAATNTQSVLDSVPAAGATDLRKNRSVFNNIILSTTGAAKTLEMVIPQVTNFGFMADSIRIPTNTVSLIALNITFSSSLDEKGMPSINANSIKEIYKTAANGNQKGLLVFSTKQNVSADLLGFAAAIVIEGNDIH
ncbi:MAG TPA: glyceraldehyde 3-phosphate dehydrogenase NAD-binding domain-containing protein, partial [Bacteroidales bacterium]|nr:glyceraldehyde 3-phosphate dehydrogenase NAD-binding domain-containing protein [Bacteroidales bacterium]HNV17965.1 glyceraldehyde 3-phosphate dehydrogenase NAD-binding domain-containing protein [Bacteroidales bacterium]HOU35482.1 glyceraldehyde 3-phosphate dehydrogenase NAD-binding domain-containing protein [Bacteroidales bacterium]HOX80847.1 glyceraldehyde 3-phosphate dehydrogenase NAD-binding domain-containing protein [Bacteroidales bacterium]HPN49866.1 glyceraldehyde 3-phosphate dehydroge